MKYIVWIREDGQWVDNGDGPMTKREAERVAREIRRECRTAAIALPAGYEPKEKR